MRFTKMHGLGNDFLVVDATLVEDVDWASAAPVLCDRHRGVGADGVLLVGRGDGGRMRMRLVNADGSEAEMCGNGVRCAAVWAAERGMAGSRAEWETAAGPIATELLGGGKLTRERQPLGERQTLSEGMVRVDMGPPRFAPADIPLDVLDTSGLRVEVDEGALAAYPVGMGNPHCVVLLESGGELDRVDAGRIAAAVSSALPFPAGVNVEVVEIVAPLHVRQRTVERGVGETDACGTGACATVAALRHAGLIAASGQVGVQLRGGTLAVDWPGGGPVLMTGPAAWVFEGDVALPAAATTLLSSRQT